MTFRWFDLELAYETGEYNSARFNERAVEVPIARAFIDSYDPLDVLEVGNVLSHYQPARHRIVDLWEEAGPRVENIDLFDIEGSYDRIVSISTIEHVRWDDKRDPLGGLDAIRHLRSLLRPKGQLLVTIPFSYNPAIDTLILADDLDAFVECSFIRDGDGWRQTESLTWRPYGETTPWAEAVYIGQFGPLEES